MAYRAKHVRQRSGIKAVGVVAGLVVGALMAWGLYVARPDTPSAGAAASSQPTSTPTVSSVSPTPSIPSPTAVIPFDTSGPPSAELRLKLVKTIDGDISPKSVAASGTGLVFAQNMMYNDTVTVYDARGRLMHTISDAVRLSRFGFDRYPDVVRGSPVEAAFSPDGRTVYVSNYSMYGPGFPSPGHDSCSPADGHDRSFLFKIDVITARIEDVIQVGSVPKVVATTPDGRYVLDSNWCSYDLSVSSTRTDREIERIPIGPYPRGIAIDDASRYAYVAVMGSTQIAKIDLRTFKVSWITDVGSGPRALVLSPDGRFLYATLNSSNAVAKIDLRTEEVVGRTTVGSEPRSMTIAPDGLSLYLVNYNSDTAMKIRARDMVLLQTVQTGTDPIGITYEPMRDQVWISNYTGSIMVFDEVRPADA